MSGPPVEFFKVSGSGNDFIALVEPATDPGEERIRAWCRRGVSLGADGLLVLRRTPGGAAMRYWNADGLPADLCLNGTRCAARLAFDLGWAERRLEMQTDAGSFTALRLDGPDGTRVAIELPMPGPGEGAAPCELELEAAGRRVAGWALTVGVPHLVVPWPEGLAAAPVVELGRPLRSHPALGAPGANVSFVRFPAPRRMEIRTYERGVEAETLSCGTGVLAAAAVGLHLGRIGLPLAVATQGGFELEVNGDPGPGRWSLAGDARVVARGELLPEAEAAPPAPPWSD